MSLLTGIGLIWNFGWIRTIGLILFAPSLIPAAPTTIEASTPAGATTFLCSGKPATIVGTAGDDLVIGTVGNDVIVAGNGNDQIFGLAGRDYVCAGTGDDAVELVDGRDFVDAGSCADSVAAGGAVLDVCALPQTSCLSPGDWLDGGPGDDHLQGGDDGDTLLGGDGNDVLLGQEGLDRLDGGEDDDLLDGGEGSDIADFSRSIGAINASLAIEKSKGWGEDRLLSIERVWGSSYNDFIEGDDTSNEIRGGSGGDTLAGLGGSDSLLGADGPDQLFGGAGDDILNADETKDLPGPDLADGGSDVDRCFYADLVRNCELD